MVEVQTLCFHIISEFLYKSKMSKREENSYYSSKTENIMNWLKSIIKTNLAEKIPPNTICSRQEGLTKWIINVSLLACELRNVK